MCYANNERQKEERGGYAMANVLIVDDSIFMQSFIGDIIEKLGHKVIGTAQNGEEAIKQIC